LPVMQHERPGNLPDLRPQCPGARLGAVRRERDEGIRIIQQARQDSAHGVELGSRQQRQDVPERAPEAVQCRRLLWLVSVRAWDWATGQEAEMLPYKCGLGHRTSVFKHSHRWTILTVTFALTPGKLGPPLTYRAVAEAAGVRLGERVLMDETVAAVRDVRAEKGMILNPSDHDGRTAGSVFLSPVITADADGRLRADGAPVNDFPDGATRVSASWLMKTAGFSLGRQLASGARISRKHFTLVADDGATATSFAAAATIVAQRVQQATGITITAEPDLLGDLPAYARLSTVQDAEN